MHTLAAALVIFVVFWRFSPLLYFGELVTPMRRQIIDSLSQFCAIPLDQAWYCESCRAVCNYPTCLCCASAAHTQRLALWLDREREPISIPLTGVILSVIPDSKKHPKQESFTPLHQIPRAS